MEPGYSALDHDQRNTLNVGMNGNLPYRVYASFNIYYGSGFSNGYQDPPSPYSGAYLPGHAWADLAVGKEFGENLSVSVQATNIANTRVLLDNSLTFGGFHYNDPRQIYGEVRYGFTFRGGCSELGSCLGEGRTAGPSTALRSGRDDKV